jgi:hypothetical protein
MNFTYVFGGLAVIILGIFLVRWELRKLKHDLQGKGVERARAIADALLFPPAIIGALLTFFGLLAVCKGFGFLVK